LNVAIDDYVMWYRAVSGKT